MDKIINDYLGIIEKHLRTMETSERVDMLKEIKSEIFELKTKGMSSEQIIERLGNPKELAKAYLGESIYKSSTFSWSKFASVIAFYCLVGIKGMFVLPIISVSAIVFVICGVIIPIAGIIKFIAYVLGYAMPQIRFEIGSFSAGPIAFLPISIVLGLLLFIAGKKLWKLTIKYIQTICKRRSINIKDK